MSRAPQAPHTVQSTAPGRRLDGRPNSNDPPPPHIYRYTLRVAPDVRILRLAAGLTQDALAAASGVAQPNIAAYESGRRRPSKATMARLRSAAPPRPSAVVTQHRDEIRRLVAHHRGSDARIIGSVARGTDRSGSDLDLVVRFSDDASLYDLVELREDLHDLLGVDVDVLSERAMAAADLSIKDSVPL